MVVVVTAGGNEGGDTTALLKRIHSVLEERDAPSTIKRRKIDDTIRRILDDKRRSVTEKATAYAQALQRQRNLTKQPVQPDRSMPLQSIIDSVPKTFKSKAERLMSYLRQKGIRWTDNGELIDGDGVRVPQSHMSDLVNDLMRYRKKSHPEGRNELASLLQTINVPREFIGNDERWKAITAARAFATPDTPPASPSSPRRHKQRAKRWLKY